MAILMKLGFGTLMTFALVLLTSVFLGMFSVDYSIMALALAMVSGGFFLRVFLDWNKLNQVLEESEIKLEFEDVLNFIAVVGGAFVAFSLSIELGISAVLASGITGVLATLILPRFDVPIFCGSFVGMASYSLLPGYQYLGLAAVIAGGVFVLGKAAFNGFGGKLGTIAFIGCVIAAILTGQSFSGEPVIQGELLEFLLIYSVIGAVVTFTLSERLDNSAVISSGAVGVMAAVILPILYPEFGNTLAVMTYCASFAGMSSLKRIKDEFMMAFAGIICAIVFAFSAPYLGGAGGKLGTTAFISVITVNGVGVAYKYFKHALIDTVRKRKTPQKQQQLD